MSDEINESPYAATTVLLEILLDNSVKGTIQLNLNNYIGQNQVTENIQISQNAEEMISFTIELVEVVDDEQQFVQFKRQNSMQKEKNMSPAYLIDKVKLFEDLNIELKS